MLFSKSYSSKGLLQQRCHPSFQRSTTFHLFIIRRAVTDRQVDRTLAVGCSMLGVACWMLEQVSEHGRNGYCKLQIRNCKFAIPNLQFAISHSSSPDSPVPGSAVDSGGVFLVGAESVVKQKLAAGEDRPEDVL